MLIETYGDKLGFNMRHFDVSYSAEAGSLHVRSLLLKFILPLYPVSTGTLLFLQIQLAEGHLICLKLIC